MAVKKVETPNYTDRELDEMAKESAKLAEENGRVKVRVPIDQLNKDDKVVHVIVNGYPYYVKRGESQMVPEVVAQILEEAGYI